MRGRVRGVILKSDGEIEAMKHAGLVSAAVLRGIGELCKPGVTTKELDDFAEEFIRSHGGKPTFKGYYGYPASICASVNEQIVHGIPSKNTVLRKGDIISIDVGATVDGWAGDNAWTFAVGEVSLAARRLLDATEECMWAGIDAARTGGHLGDIGHAVSAVAKREGFGVVRDFEGHGIGRDMHEEPGIPNFGRRGSGLKLVPGMVLAIEPMITMGSPRVKMMPDGWLACTRDGLPSAHFEKTIAVTKDGPALISVEPDHRRPI